MPIHSRNKGRRGELEWAKYVGGDRISEEGLPGPDVESIPLGIHPPLAKWDSKRPGVLPKWMSEGWMQKALNDGCDAIAFREDGGKWWILMPAERLDR